VYGTKGQAFVDAAAARFELGPVTHTFDGAAAKAALGSGKLVMVSHNGGPLAPDGGHYVVLTGIDAQRKCDRK